jgi:hypothetical protein
MSTSTLSPATPRSQCSAHVLIVVADTGAGRTWAVPEWAAHWCHGAGWELRRHPEAGPLAAALAARQQARVLVLRPSDPLPALVEPVERVPPRFPRVVAALQGLPDDVPVLADAAACAARTAAVLTLVHAVPRSFAERSVDLAGAVAHGRRLLDAAARRVSSREPGLGVECQLRRERPHELVGETLEADLLVVGGPRARPAEPSLDVEGPGLVARSALHHAPCPVLLSPR